MNSSHFLATRRYVLLLLACAVVMTCLFVSHRSVSIAQAPSSLAPAPKHKEKFDIVKHNVAVGEPLNIQTDGMVYIGFNNADPAFSQRSLPARLSPIRIVATGKVRLVSVPEGTPLDIHAGGSITVTYYSNSPARNAGKVSLVSDVNITLIGFPVNTPLNCRARYNASVLYGDPFGGPLPAPHIECEDSMLLINCPQNLDVGDCHAEGSETIIHGK